MQYRVLSVFEVIVLRILININIKRRRRRRFKVLLDYR